jgi:hypothetical protein
MKKQCAALLKYYSSASLFASDFEDVTASGFLMFVITIDTMLLLL